MSPRTDLLCFTDLETTGADGKIDEIIEVGIAVYSWPQWDEIASFSSIVVPSRESRARMDTKEVVREMHRVNGLTAEIDAIINDLDALQEFLPEAVDERIARLLKPFGPSHLILAGSGVSHFDRQFIRRQLPKFDKMISYWALDVGVMRRNFARMGLATADDSGKTHRALEDARVHAEEQRFYEAALARLVAYDEVHGFPGGMDAFPE